jgi:hypothetical protein
MNICHLGCLVDYRLVCGSIDTLDVGAYLKFGNVLSNKLAIQVGID